MMVEGIKRDDHGSNDHNKCDANGVVQNLVCNSQDWVPTDVRLFCSENSLGEDQVENVDYQDSGIDEDVCCDCKSDVVLSGCPCNTENEGSYSCGTKARHQDCQEEFVISSAVLLEDGYICS